MLMKLPKRPPKVPTKILQQLKEVRDAGDVNMMDAHGVQQAVHSKGLGALVAYLDPNPTDGYQELIEAFAGYLSVTVGQLSP